MNNQLKSKITLAVADDHVLFRKGLINLLSDFDFTGHIYEAGNGLELLELLKNADPFPDMVLLDMRMPVMDGVEATEKIKELFPSLKIIILTMQDDENFILHMIEKGINSYLLKNVEPDELEKVLTILQSREFFFNEKLSNLVVKALYSKGKKEVRIDYSLLLTKREIEVLTLICEELTSTEIADKLHVSRRTIEGHRNSLFEKTGAKNTVGLVLFAIRNGIVPVG